MSDAWAPPAEIQMHLPGAGAPALLIFKSPAGGFSEEEEPEEPGEGTENSQLHVGVSENAARSLCLPSLPPRVVLHHLWPGGLLAPCGVQHPGGFRLCGHAEA